MRNASKYLLAGLLVLFAAGTCSAGKKMIIVNIDKGAMPDTFAGAAGSLEDNEKYCGKKGGMSLKVEINSADGGNFISECPPKQAVWAGWDLLKFNIYNPGKSVMKINFVIKPKAAPTDYNKRIDFNAQAKPGMNEMEFELTGTCTNGGELFNFKEPIAMWVLDIPEAKKGDVYYLSNMRLEMADDSGK